MKKETILDSFIRTCYDGFLQGWHERNGGNLTYHLDSTEVAQLADLINNNNTLHYDLPGDFSILKNEYFITTGSNRFMRNAPLDPETTLGIIKIDEKGLGYNIVWGLKNSKPTSELPTHLLNHINRNSVTHNCKVIYHAHPANITALSYTIDIDSRILTRILWQSETECAVVFPQGVGIVDWMIPGGMDIAIETSKLIKEFPAVVWAYHGLFCAGSTLDETFGLMHTIEKAAEIYLKAKTVGIKHTITDENLKELAKAFKVELNPKFL